MKSRDHARRAAAAEARREASRADAGETSVEGLPEILHAARERKGVDLYRAERDTKIRARYLAALERGDYRELPGSVYTRGFLRNYALYLGLDPEEVLGQYRRERGDHASADAVVIPRRMLLASGRALTLSPNVVVAALMGLIVVALGVYLAVQLLRFAKPPFLEVTRPVGALVDGGESDTTYTIEGRSIAGATITITTPGHDEPYQVTASPDGSWAIQVDLRRGQNKFDVSALDPDTGRQADTHRVIQINVPFLVVQAPTLTVAQPVDGTTSESGVIPIEGTTTNATNVLVETAWLGPPPTPTAKPGTPTAKPSATAATIAMPSPAPIAPLTLPVGDDGTFAGSLELPAGRWTVTITASSPQGKSASLARAVTLAYRGINLVVTIKGQATWIKVWVDNVIDSGISAAGKTIADGKAVTFTGQKTVEVRTGSSGSTLFTLNSTSIGALGKVGAAETWLFEPPSAPVKTARQ